MPCEGRPLMALAAWSRRALTIGAAAWLVGCSTGAFNSSDLLPAGQPGAPPAADPAPSFGNGGTKVGLILPLSAGGNAGSAGQAMRNAAELALAEFNSPNIQFVPKDDGGTAQGAQQAAQQAVDDGAEILLGPLFAHSVNSAKQVARTRGIPIIAFSTDSN